MVKIEGKSGISATVIADSINSAGNRLTTFELIYPRFIHSEVMTHRMLSKNSASSRAIPIARMIELIEESPAEPVFWGKNKAGMSATEELSGDEKLYAKMLWGSAMVSALDHVTRIDLIGLHKQIANRISEPWQMMKSVVSGTEWANMLWLRNHDAAQPEFHELARCVAEAFEQSAPQFLSPGQWHLPYVKSELSGQFVQVFENDMTLEDAQKVSASCCAQVSYRRLDDSIGKALDIYNKLVGMDRAHASPFEHLGTPMTVPTPFAPYERGVTHKDVKNKMWSANFCGFIQYRKLLPDEAVW
jgi:thymidylate synthase ThyX